MIAASRIDYRRICRNSFWFYGIMLAFLLVTLFLGPMISGSRRWILMGAVRFQPSEFTKLALIFSLAYVVVRVRDQLGWFWASMAALIVTLPPFALTVVEPDLGTSIVFLAIWFGMLFLAGMDFRYMLGYLAFFAMLVPVGLQFLKPYQWNRLTSFMNPESDPLHTGYQVIQSKIAIGHGGLFGQGLFQGSQNALGFIPGEHTDFIFSIAAEELGVVGAGLILIGLFLLLLIGIAISDVTDDLLGKLVAGGIIAWLGFQIVVNVGIALGLLPVTGIPLPFISYGGSALLANSFAVGILVSVYRHAATKGRMMFIREV
jgi:rod shape determining protein RodA